MVNEMVSYVIHGMLSIILFSNVIYITFSDNNIYHGVKKSAAIGMSPKYCVNVNLYLQAKRLKPFQVHRLV